MISFPDIMAIVNVTPDSFSDGGDFLDSESAVAQAERAIAAGATFVDVGGESTRPGAEPVPSDIEIRRTEPVIRKIREKFSIIKISIDTTKIEVARAAVAAGADMINDVSGLRFSPEIADLAAESGCAVAIMHMLGEPRTMQNNPRYDDLIAEISEFLSRRVEFARSRGVNEIYVDPGIGFGKTVEHNFEILRSIDRFAYLGAKVMLGISRKSFIGKTLGLENPKDRDCAGALIHALLLDKKIDLIRVHNVETLAVLKILSSKLSS